MPVRLGTIADLLAQVDEDYGYPRGVWLSAAGFPLGSERPEEEVYSHVGLWPTIQLAIAKRWAFISLTTYVAFCIDTFYMQDVISLA